MLRRVVQTHSPNLSKKKVRISSGIAFENAYFSFVGYNSQRMRYLSFVFGRSIWFSPRRIVPDHVQPTSITNGKTEIVFPRGGYIEVKAPGYGVGLFTSNTQAEAYINNLPYAMNLLLVTTAGQMKAASLTYVLPYGARIDSELIRRATTAGVNLYLSYAFQNRETGGMLFSTHYRLNEISTQLGGGPNTIGSMNGVQLDIAGAVSRWGDSNEQEE